MVNGSPPVQDLTAAEWPWQNVWTYKDGPAKIHPLSINGESYDVTFSATFFTEYAHPVPAVSNQGCFTDYHPNQKLQQCFLAECYLLQEPWFTSPNCPDAVSNNWLWILGYLLNTTSTIFPTHDCWQLAPRLLNTTRIILPLTLPHMTHFRLNSGKLCKMSSQHSFRSLTAGTMFHTLLIWVSYWALERSK